MQSTDMKTFQDIFEEAAEKTTTFCREFSYYQTNGFILPESQPNGGNKLAKELGLTDLIMLHLAKGAAARGWEGLKLVCALPLSTPCDTVEHKERADSLYPRKALLRE